MVFVHHVQVLVHVVHVDTFDKQSNHEAYHAMGNLHHPVEKKPETKIIKIE